MAGEHTHTEDWKTLPAAGNTAPLANPAGPYLAAIPFDGSLSSDPDGDPLTYALTFGTRF